MKDLIELLCTEEEIDKNGKQCCMDWSAQIEVQSIIFIINTLVQFYCLNGKTNANIIKVCINKEGSVTHTHIHT